MKIIEYEFRYNNKKVIQNIPSYKFLFLHFKFYKILNNHILYANFSIPMKSSYLIKLVL